MTIALIHPDRGTHFVYDKAERDRLVALGWKVRPDNWKELKRAARTAEQVAADEAKEKEEAERREFEAWKARKNDAAAVEAVPEAEAPKPVKRTKGKAK